MVGKYERLMGSIVATDMDFNQLDEFLKAQMKKKEVRMTKGSCLPHTQTCAHHRQFTHVRMTYMAAM